MAYCTSTDVEAITGSSYSTSTTPTLVSVNKYIDWVYDKINRIISQMGFDTPLTTNDFLTMLNAKGAAYQAESASYKRIAPNDTDYVERLRIDYEEDLKRLESKSFLISLGGVESGSTSISYSPENDDDMQFTVQDYEDNKF